MVSIIVIYVCVVHYVYAVALMVEPSSVGITAISAVVLIIHDAGLTAGCFLAVASLAIIGLSYSDSVGLYLLLPQQVVLIVSAAGAIEAMASGQFADGVVRPHMFLIADQSPTVAAAVCHTAVLARMGRMQWNGKP